MFFRKNLRVNIFILIFISAGISGCKKDKKVKEDAIVSTYYLIRHAEKDRTNPENIDPELNQDGLGRAIRWAEVFETIDLDVIYSTNYERTSMTAAPTSVKKNIDIKYYTPDEIDIEAFKEENLGKNILIVGHSNTTPDLVNKLLENYKYQDMEDTDNSSLYIVRFIDDEVTDIQLKMN